MENKDLPRLTAVLRRLCAVFGRTFSEELAEGYFVALADSEIGDVEGNAIVLLKNSDRMPAPVDLRWCEEDWSSEYQAAAEWAEIQAASRAGKHVTGLSTPAQEALRFIGGWQTLGDATTRDMSFLRRDFISIFVEDLENTARGERLRGALEDHEHKRIGSTVKLGDVLKAEARDP